jgi:hypothetical protein
MKNRVYLTTAMVFTMALACFTSIAFAGQETVEELRAMLNDDMHYYSDILDGGNGADGSTTGSDIFRGVAEKPVGSQDQTTLNSSDILDGGAEERKEIRDKQTALSVVETRSMARARKQRFERITEDIKYLEKLYAYARGNILKGDQWWHLTDKDPEDSPIPPSYYAIVRGASKAELIYFERYMRNAGSLVNQIVMLAVLAKRIQQNQKELESIAITK